jgi:hypothetical protein
MLLVGFGVGFLVRNNSYLDAIHGLVKHFFEVCGKKSFRPYAMGPNGGRCGRKKRKIRAGPVGSRGLA